MQCASCSNVSFRTFVITCVIKRRGFITIRIIYNFRNVKYYKSSKPRGITGICPEGLDNMTEAKWWDFTASKAMGWAQDRIIPILEPIADRFVLGDEVGEGGYEHVQGRVVFKVGKELGALQNIMPGVHWTPTHVRNFDYCEKEGNFYRSWEKGLKQYTNIDLRQWQGQAVAQFKDQGDRTVMVIVDPVGGKGKTVLAKYCVVNRYACYCPPMQDAQDFMAFALAHKNAPGFIFDMPRTESTKQRKGMWSAIEQIKNGYYYDKRYSWQEHWAEKNPRIMVITNEMPDLDTLSRDRWEIYTIKNLWGDDSLERYEPSD